MRSSGAFSGAKAPAALVVAAEEHRVPAHPRGRVAQRGRWCAGAPSSAARRPIPEAVRPTACQRRPRGGGTLSRHSVAPPSTALAAPTKNSSRWSRRPAQKALASGLGNELAAERACAADTAAAAPDRRSTSMPSHQALAFSGSGWPPHSFRRLMALAWSARSAAWPWRAAGQHLERDLADHAQHAHAAGQQARHVVAGHVLHHLAAKAQHFARPVSSVAPST
jgi:hypothetical protein